MTHANGLACQLSWDPPVSRHVALDGMRGQPLKLQPVLVADNTELATAVVDQVRTATGQACFLSSFQEGAATAPRHLDPLVILLASSPEEVLRTRQYVQEVSLQKLASIIVILTVENCCDGMVH